jgi:hypothetical protein
MVGVSAISLVTNDLTTDKQIVSFQQKKFPLRRLHCGARMRNRSLSWGSKNTLDSQGSLSVAQSHERVGNTLPEIALSFSR